MRTCLTPWILALFVSCLSSCSLTAPFSAKALENATNLKADSLTLLEKSNQSFSSHRKEAAEIEKQLRRAYEFSKARDKNSEAIGQYEIMRDPNRRMLVGLLRRWENKGRISGEFARTESIDLVSRGWDSIIALEQGKKDPNQ